MLRTFSPGQPWRHAVAGASPPTLGSTAQAMRSTSRVSASRRELNSHGAAEPRVGNRPRWNAEKRTLRELDRVNTKVTSASLSRKPRRGRPTVNGKEPACHIVPVDCVGTSGFQSVRRAVAASAFPGFMGCQRRRLEYVPRIARQRGAGGTCCSPSGIPGPWQAHRYCLPSTVLPNPSLKRSANGRPPGPVSRYGVHFLLPGPGVLPSSPA